eukprot:m.67087 g.67087  ORF g.67087 m.67087 type:complete len:487 (-) comp7653_c0_seq1:71-1531(-)
MTNIARDAWGFEGYITSDCGAVQDVIETHHYTSTPEETCKVTLEAGMDIDCGSYIRNHLYDAVSKGAVSYETIDGALVNLFKVQMRLGIFDPVSEQPYLNYTFKDKVNTPAHQQLALDAARQGIVLLQNDNNRLPLQGRPTIALVGPNSNATTTMQGNYQGVAPFLTTISTGLKAYTDSVQQSDGCDVPCKRQDGFANAISLAKSAQAVVLVVGLAQSQESEGHDRDDISLPGYQDSLIEQVADAAQSPITLIVMSGSSVDISAAKANKKVGAILWCGYPGQSGGQAIADVLFGAYNPAGRLPITFYPAAYTAVSMFDDHMRPNATSGNPGRTYRFYTGEAVYEYGDGLSYTTFSYSAHNVTAPTVPSSLIEKYIAESPNQHFRADAPEAGYLEVKVTNTGQRAGSDVVLVFIRNPTPGIAGASLKDLFGFERVFLAPGQSQTVQFPYTMHDLTLVDSHGKRVARRGTWTIEVGNKGQLQVPVQVV